MTKAKIGLDYISVDISTIIHSATLLELDGLRTQL